MENEENLKSKVAHTYSDDMVGALGENQSGTVRNLIEAEEEREKLRESLSPQSKKNQLFLALGSLLFVCSLAGIVYTVLTSQGGAVNGPSTYKPLIFSDKTKEIPVGGFNKDTLANTIYNEVENSTLSPGKLENIYLTENKSVISIARMMEILKSNLKPEAYDILGSKFSLGVLYTQKKERHPFVLMTTKSFQGIFPIMKEWEGKMFYDLHGLFGLSLDPSTSYLMTKDFENGILQNKNARILYTKDNTIAIAYVYLDESNILLTDSEDVVKEIILRFSSTQIPK